MYELMYLLFPSPTLPSVVHNRTHTTARGKTTLNRLALSALLLAAASFSLPAHAQSPAPSTAQSNGCGSPAIRFDVESDRGLHPAPMAPSRALVFFVQDDSEVSGFRKPVVRLGLDGKWEGATHGNSYIFFYVDPGQHHLCTDWQDGAYFLHKGPSPSATLSFTAKAGATYYFQVSNTFRGTDRTATLLEPVTPSNPEDYLNDYNFAFFHQLP
jgi:hypothetical protein